MRAKRTSREAIVRRRRHAAATIAVVLIVAAALATARPWESGSPAFQPDRRTSTTQTATATTRSATPRPPGPPFAVGVRTVRFVDASRTVDYRNGTSGPRVLNTEVRYPALGDRGGAPQTNAVPQRASGPFPLIVFGHGFEQLPSTYAVLLNAWARAGYVVAAPIFPDENADAPGGPEEEDLVNQPGDMRFVTSEMLAADRAAEGPFSGLIDPEEIAVAGHSDGGDTALAVAYDPAFQDRRVKAAVILSGAMIPFLPAFAFPAGGPPLLATQGTADIVNKPGETAAYFDAAHNPKYLLDLIGAEHLPPYTGEQPQLRIVEQVSIDFLNRYLKGRSGALAHMIGAGSVPGVASMQVDR